MSEEIKNVIIFGGAFDPVTNAHVQCVRFLASRFPNDEIWVMPCLMHTFHKRMADFYHRFAMCKIAVLAVPRTKVCDFEHKGKTDGSTYALLHELKQTYPDTNFRVVIGYDNAQTIEKWKNWKQLIGEVPFIVLSRKGCEVSDADSKWYTQQPHTYIAQEDIMDASSTKARDVLAEYWVDKNVMGRGAALGKWCGQLTKFVPMHVFLYINDRKLYWRPHAKTPNTIHQNPVVALKAQNEAQPAAETKAG